MIDMLVDETNIYSLQKGGCDSSINTNENEMEQLFGN